MTAGAAGTTALNVVSGADAVLRARPASRAPEQLVAAVADRAGVAVPGGRSERRNRLAALGPLAGSAAGLAVGAVAGGLRAAGLRLPTAVGGPLLGAAAMLATDGPLALTRVSDPRTWSAADWTAGVLPHLAYGIATHATLVRLERGAPDAGPAAPPARPSTLIRAVALGAATGSRSTAGTAALALTSRPGDAGLAGRIGGRAGTTLTGLMAAAEAVADKQPAVPGRLGAPGLAPRLTLGSTSAAAMARRDGEDPALPALAGLAGAAGAAVLGVRARAAAARRFGSDLPGALAEDVLAALLAWSGARRRRSPDTAAGMAR
ncbi:hypothetical protein LWC33_09580 [Pseudonocardia sp. RS11V-5]|uniref:hypothetical protein n=1 Tax=Pseudonocardia terrae TaxID=2905831 RepID=UPI001E64DC39|nr:hypothetical protein [Pseudonocardia terrae]MCE3551704.1 hypothetical protein [Pseudonocardia terrae]